jgi:adenylate cyclase
MAGPWSLGKLAAVAGETEESLRGYADAGLLHRQADGDFEADSLHRLRLIQFARSRGVSDERLAAATASQGDLLRIFDEHVAITEPVGNLIEAARDLGIDADVIAELVEILDLENVDDATEADIAALRVFARALELGLPSDALLQLARIFADSMDRMADAVVRTFHNYVHERFRAEGLVGPQLLDATERVGKPLIDLIEPTVLYFHRRSYRRANREDLLRHIDEDTTPPAEIPGEERATVLFVDLASFTPLTATMGDHVAAGVLRKFSGSVRSNATQYRGRILKQIGDAFMLMFAEPAAAIEFGLAMDRFVETEPLFPALHIGAHSGTVLYREGDYVGGTVNLAARVAAAGSAGQFLITEDLRDAAPYHPDAEFLALPPRRLKGILEPIRLVEVRRSALRSNREADPVCGMFLDPSDVVVRMTWRGRTFAFCSETCKQAFDDDPDRFAGADQD